LDDRKPKNVNFSDPQSVQKAILVIKETRGLLNKLNKEHGMLKKEDVIQEFLDLKVLSKSLNSFELT
jgi:hypothetical protein